MTLPLLLLPDGRLRSPRWRWVVATSIAGATLAMAAVFAPGQLTAIPVANPFGLATAGSWLHVGSLAAALVCLVLRFRSSRGVEHQQLRWVAAGPPAPWPGCWV